MIMQKGSFMAPEMERETLRAMCQEAVADETALREAVAAAQFVPLMLVHAQLSSDRSLLREAMPFIEGGWMHMEKIPEELRERVRESLILTLKSIAAGERQPPPLTPHDIAVLLGMAVNHLIQNDYAHMFAEEAAPKLGRIRAAEWRQSPEKSLDDYNAIIVGAGIAGLCMAIVLQQAGVPFEIIEKEEEVGGVWWVNQYPGAGVDVPNHSYSYSFEPNPNWERVFGLRNEVQSYLKSVSEKYGLRSRIRFKTDLKEARYNRGTASWEVTIKEPSGEIRTLKSRFFISCAGALTQPKIQNLPGREEFRGKMFHTARWDHSADFAGKRVALVGTGASALQVGPSIASEVEQLFVFQRTPSWIGLNESYHTHFNASSKWAARHIPFYYMWQRFLLLWAGGDINFPFVQRDPNWTTPGSINARNQKVRETITAHIRSELEGRPDLLAKVIPNYPPWGKRMLRDTHWYKMLRRDNVGLVDRAVVRLTKTGLVDSDERSYPVDAIIWATGFNSGEAMNPMLITGVSGTYLRDAWKKEGPRAYMGMTVPDFPNMFIMGGPNTGVSHGGGVFMTSELQARYIAQCIREVIERKVASVEVRQNVHDHYNGTLDRAHEGLVWKASDVSTWYKNSAGRVITVLPWRNIDFWKMTGAVNVDDFIFSPL
jgi:4-hydroxyacetophenone monooxygenase